jgi:hypothetical protein
MYHLFLFLLLLLLLLLVVCCCCCCCCSFLPVFFPPSVSTAGPRKQARALLRLQSRVVLLFVFVRAAFLLTRFSLRARARSPRLSLSLSFCPLVALRFFVPPTRARACVCSGHHSVDARGGARQEAAGRAKVGPGRGGGGCARGARATRQGARRHDRRGKTRALSVVCCSSSLLGCCFCCDCLLFVVCCVFLSVAGFGSHFSLIPCLVRLRGILRMHHVACAYRRGWSSARLQTG